MLRKRIVLAVTILLSTPAFAGPIVSAGVTGGTLGVGPQVGVRGKTVGVRADATFLSLGGHFTTDDLRYRGRVHLKSGGATVDVYPFGGGFRLSAGGRYNGNTAHAHAMPMSDTRIGGKVFTPEQIGALTGTADVHTIAPVLTLGYGGKPRHGLFFGIDGGVLFQGRVHISDYTSSTGLVPRERLDAERDSLQHDVDKCRVYPIVQLSVGYRF